MSQYRCSISNSKFICFYECQKALPAVGFLYLEKKRERRKKKKTVLRQWSSTSICLDVWKGEINKSPHHALRLFQIWSRERFLCVLRNGHREKQCKKRFGKLRVRTKMGRKKRSKTWAGKLVKLEWKHLDAIHLHHTFVWTYPQKIPGIYDLLNFY